MALIAVYAFRVPVPFQSDRANLMSNPKWKRNAKNNNLRIVWADSVLKINRRDGKVPGRRKLGERFSLREGSRFDEIRLLVVKTREREGENGEETSGAGAQRLGASPRTRTRALGYTTRCVFQNLGPVSRKPR